MKPAKSKPLLTTPPEKKQPAPRLSQPLEKLQIKLTPETTNLCANGQDLCFLNIDLIGENGITKSSVDQELKIEISGPATLQGYGSARPNVEESFCNDTFKTFYGKSLAVIRAGYEPGTVTVKVSGKGLDTQELTLNIC